MSYEIPNNPEACATAPDHQAKVLLQSPLPRQDTAPSDPPIATQTQPIANMIAVTGGKGGVGKTTLAVNLAILASRAGYRTLLVDMDPGLANVDVHLRLAPTRTLADVANQTCSIEQAFCRGPGGITLLAGRSGDLDSANAPAKTKIVLDAVRQAASSFDCVIADTGAGVGPSVLATARAAAYPLLVTTPDPAALTDSYALCKLLHQRKAQRPQLVVNLARSQQEALRVAGRLSFATQKFLGQAVSLAGHILRCEAIERSVLAQRPATLSPDAPATLRELSAHLLSALPRRRVASAV